GSLLFLKVKGGEAIQNRTAGRWIQAASDLTQIHRRKVSYDGCHAIAFFQEVLFGIWISIVRGRANHQRQVAAGAASVDANAVGVDPPLFGVIADEANSASDISHDIRNQIFRAAAMTQRDHREAFGQQFFIARHGRRRWDPGRYKAAADHEDYGGAVLALRLEDV